MKKMKHFKCVLSMLVCCIMGLINNSVALSASCSHPVSTWEIDEDSYDITSGIVWMYKYCDSCGAAIDTKLKSFPMHQGNTFVFTPNEFAERFQARADLLKKHYGGELFSASIDTMDNGQLICSIRNAGYDGVAGIQFADTKTYLKNGDQDQAEISCVMAFLLTDDVAEQVGVMMNVILTCDGSLEVSDASKIAKSALFSSSDGTPYRHNDIGYAFSPVDGGFLFVASLLDK